MRRPTGDEPLVATYDYRLPHPTTPSDSASIYQSTCQRYDALTILARGLRDPSDEELLEVLTDRELLQNIMLAQDSSGEWGAMIRDATQTIDVVIESSRLRTARRVR